MKDTEVLAEMNHDGNRIDVRFKVRFTYGGEPDPETERRLGLVRSIAGRRFDKPRRVWTVPLDWQSARELRRAFGENLVLGPDLRAWGREERARQAKLAELSAPAVPEVGLEWLPKLAPDLATAIHLGPKGLRMSPSERRAALDGPPSFQAADVRFMVESANPLNANHMGLGKTIETIAAIIEQGLHDGPILVVAPVSAAEGTWPEELAHWQDGPVWLARGTAEAKRAVHEEFRDWVSPVERTHTPNGKGYIEGNGGWLIVNPEQIQLREEVQLCERHTQLSVKRAGDLKVIKACSDSARKLDEEELFFSDLCFYRTYYPYPDLFKIEWNAVIFDEAHEHGVLNPKSLTGRGARALRALKLFMLTGTPMGGKEIRLFEILQFLNPKVFTSKWRFAERYLEMGETTFYKKGGRGATQTAKTIGGIRRCAEHKMAGIRAARGECPECDKYEDYFFEQLGPYVLRRTKAEVVPDLPDKQFVELWCPFGSERHRKQYEQFADDAEAVIDGKLVTATNVISEYTRLGQFSFGTYANRDGVLVPTEDSGKLQVLEEKLRELGIFEPGDSQAVIFSQYRKVVDLVHAWLYKKGVAVGKLTGATTRAGERAALKSSFQGEGGIRVLVVSTGAGGTSLTLDRASDVFMLDEDWNPDRDEQAQDRCHRASRIHQVTIWRLRTKGTLDEYRMEVAWDKAARNKNVMDLRRIKLKEDD